jgi:hypothetical protein
MLKHLGPLGITGLAISLVGLGLVAYASPVVAVGIALLLLGLGLVIKALVSGVLRQFGMV